MYFDPVIGSLVIQWILGGLLAVIFMGGIFRKRLARVFRKLFRKRGEDEPDS